MTGNTDLYGVLGVTSAATQEEIRARYRVLVRQYHPDLHPGDAQAAEKMEQVNAAYDILGDPQERCQYDEQVRSSSVWGTQSSSQTYRPPSANPQSSWNPQWGTDGDPRDRQAEAEAMWEAVRARQRSAGGLFDDVWVDVPVPGTQSMNGFAVIGRIVWLIVRIIFGILFVVLRLLNTRVDDRTDFF